LSFSVVVFHTFFGIAGLSLLGKFPESSGKFTGYIGVDPAFALPVNIVKELGLKSQRA
jgi:hypothetical protein